MRCRSSSATRSCTASGPVPFPALQSLFDGLYSPGLQWYWRADFVKEFPDAAIEQHVEFADRLPTLHSAMHMYPIDGAVHDVANADTPFGYRDANWAEVIVGVDPDPANAALIRDWTVDYWDATHPYSAGGAYVNFMMDEGHARVRASYGEQLRPPREDEGRLRPGQRVPRQPEHRAEGGVAALPITAGRRGGPAGPCSFGPEHGPMARSSTTAPASAADREHLDRSLAR